MCQDKVEVGLYLLLFYRKVYTSSYIVCEQKLFFINKKCYTIIDNAMRVIRYEEETYVCEEI